MTSPTLPTHPPRPIRASHRRSTSLASIASITSLTPKSVVHFVFPLFILFLIVIASSAQTEVAHYLTTELDYHQAYFTFYLTHITFALVFPLHLILLRIFRRTPIRVYLDGIRYTIAEQLGDSTANWRAITPRWSRTVTWLTLLISVPALTWFVAMNMTTGLAVTTIYATSAFWTYLFSMILLKEPLSKVTAGSIALAFVGVIVLSLDGLDGESHEGAPNAMLGDIIMMFGAVVLGLYEVVYKMALPEGAGGVTSSDEEDYEALLVTPGPVPSLTPPESRPDSPNESSHPRTAYPSILRVDEGRGMPLHPRIDRQTSRTPLLRIKTPPSPPLSSNHTPLTESPILAPTLHRNTHHTPPELPTALHSNFLTSCIGLATLILLWIPIPILHSIGWEKFRWPGEGGGDPWTIWGGLQVVAWGGAIYNAGLMALIGIWGPTTSSVANLLAIGLVAVIEAVWSGSLPSLQTSCGVGMICVGFGILLWEGEN